MFLVNDNSERKSNFHDFPYLKRYLGNFLQFRNPCFNTFEILDAVVVWNCYNNNIASIAI